MVKYYMYVHDCSHIEPASVIKFAYVLVLGTCARVSIYALWASKVCCIEGVWKSTLHVPNELGASGSKTP